MMQIKRYLSLLVVALLPLTSFGCQTATAEALDPASAGEKLQTDETQDVKPAKQKKKKPAKKKATKQSKNKSDKKQGKKSKNKDKASKKKSKKSPIEE